MKILLAGDVHGRFPYLKLAMSYAKKQVPDLDLCIQVGDFGFYSSIFEAHLRDYGFPYKVLAIDGNHENHKWLHKRMNKEFAASRNLEYIPRGTVMEFDGRKIGFIGGAMNVDRKQEGNVRFGTQNFISKKDVKHALEEFNKHELDVIISHSCPHGIGVGVVGHPFFLPTIMEHILIPYNLPATDINDCGEHALKDLWDGLIHKPKHWIFGHFHYIHENTVDGTHFVCIGCTDFTDNERNPSFLPFFYDTIDNQISIGDRVSYSAEVFKKNDGREFKI